MRAWIGRMSKGTRGAILSFLIPGLGQLYLGLLSRAVIWFSGLIVLAAVIGDATEPAWAKPVLALGLAVCSTVDAYLMAPRQPPHPGT